MQHIVHKVRDHVTAFALRNYGRAAEVWLKGWAIGIAATDPDPNGPELVNARVIVDIPRATLLVGLDHCHIDSIDLAGPDPYGRLDKILTRSWNPETAYDSDSYDFSWRKALAYYCRKPLITQEDEPDSGWAEQLRSEWLAARKGVA